MGREVVRPLEQGVHGEVRRESLRDQRTAGTGHHHRDGSQDGGADGATWAERQTEACPEGARWKREVDTGQSHS